MSDTMIALGGYRFSLTSAAYQEIRKSHTYRWQAQERLQRRPAQQFVGLGNETQTLLLTNGLPRKQEFQLRLTRYGEDQ